MNKTAVKDTYRPLLRHAGLKATPERLLIVKALRASKRPLSVKELRDKLKTTEVDQATIYRTIEALLEKNLVRAVNFKHDHNHYELIGDEHHHHLICEKCGKVVDVSKCDTSKIEQQVKELGNFARINSHALEFFGFCKTCAKSGR